MFKVMIVEDELLVRVGLKNSIPWHEFEMEVVADVANGREALNVYRAEELDLIVTDLKMPVMDGLELISTIREENSEIRILILSCIEEFEYARKAAGLKVSGYILKLTMSLDEMEHVLREVHKELLQRKRAVPEPLNHPLNLKMLKGKLIKDNIFYGFPASGDLETALRQVDPRIESGQTVIALLETSHYSRLLKRFQDERGELIHFTISNILDEIVNKHHAGEAFHDSDNHYLILFTYPADISEGGIYSHIRDVFDNIVRAMHSYLDIPVFMGVSRVYPGWSMLRQMYEQCSSIVQNRFLSDGFLKFASQWCSEDLELLWKRKMLQSCSLWQGMGSRYAEDLQQEMAKRLGQPLAGEEAWRQMFIELINWSYAYLEIPKEHAELLELSEAERIRACYTIETCIQEWEKHLKEASKMKDMVRTVSVEVEKAVRFIQQNYGRDITLKEVSDYVRLSPNYLSLLFKKSIGRNLTEYLTEYRIEKAKDLLLNTSLKTYEIAENVGVADSAYFSRIFKKYAGVSPLEFRKKKVLSKEVSAYENS
ncbi:response regulator transcription factor [Paenibacillus physcomitrellae]|uniref:Response regulator n=1 Tax=Paenibacillus physcomitrellae TaxID=1619311 RepID=A0ABQ1GFN1_9BACL|nr:response regulator [Paenibacillus physcomitrellae]GGA42925.1 hypothetical protein GCM10010917_30350 [Paenibacillus physcomitrellae]